MPDQRSNEITSEVEATPSAINLKLTFPGDPEPNVLPLTHAAAALLCGSLATALGMAATALLSAVTMTAIRDQVNAPDPEPKGRIIRVDPTGRRS